MEEKRVDGLDDIGQDDFFGDDGNDDGQAVMMSPMAERDLAVLKTRLTTLGYQDGVEDGVEEVVQDGFDKGFAAGAAAGWEVGSLYGGCAAAAAALKQAAAASRGRHHPPSAEPPTGHGAGSTAPHVEAKGVGEANECSETIDDHPTREMLPGVGGPTTTRTSERTQHEGDRKQYTTFDEGLGSTTVGREWRRIEELSQLVEELKQASLVGLDGPSVDKAGILRRLKLTGPAGEAVSNALRL